MNVLLPGPVSVSSVTVVLFVLVKVLGVVSVIPVATFSSPREVNESKEYQASFDPLLSLRQSGDGGTISVRREFREVWPIRRADEVLVIVKNRDKCIHHCGLKSVNLKN